jgi:carboxyl-terminal processing protease
VKISSLGLLVGLVIVPTVVVRAADPSPTGSETTTADRYRGLQQKFDGTIGGVGILMWRKDAGDLYIAQVIADSPAARASLRRGQVIRAINGTPAPSLAIEDAAKLARGPAETTVQLDVSEPGSVEWRRVQLVRQVIVVVVDYRMLDGNVGLLSITSFNEQTPGRVRQALEVLAAQGARGLVLDLRNSDHGDNASTQSDVAGYFVGDAAPLWLERNKGEAKATLVHSAQQRVWQKPVVGLVNHNTSGNSVLLAVALRYAGKVRLVGHSTAGAAPAELVETQPDGSARRVAVRQFSTPRDEPLASKGVAPDVSLDGAPSSAEELSRAVADLARLIPPPSAAVH